MHIYTRVCISWLNSHHQVSASRSFFFLHCYISIPISPRPSSSSSSSSSSSWSSSSSSSSASPPSWQSPNPHPYHAKDLNLLCHLVSAQPVIIDHGFSWRTSIPQMKRIGHSYIENTVRRLLAVRVSNLFPPFTQLVPGVEQPCDQGAPYFFRWAGQVEAKVAWVVLHFSGKVTLSIHVTRCHKFLFLFLWGGFWYVLIIFAGIEGRSGRERQCFEFDLRGVGSAVSKLSPHQVALRGHSRVPDACILFGHDKM